MLHLCAKNNANDCLLLLISRGSDTDPTDGEGLTPLMVALLRNHTKVALSLIELGAQIECKFVFPIDRRVETRRARRLSCFAARQGTEKCLTRC